MTSRRGFTLLELLITIAILAILAAIILMSVNIARERARDSKRTQDMEQVQRALEMYRMDHGVYPALGSAVGSCSSQCLSQLTQALVPDYISSIPLDPQIGDSATGGYRYCTQGDYTAYQIILKQEATGSYCTVRSPVTVSGTTCWTYNGVPEFPYCS